MHIEIKKMEFFHLQDVQFINYLCLPDNYPEEYYIHHMFIENNRNNYIAMVDGEIVGYVLLKEYLSHAEITSIGILREFRGRNIGKMLIEKIIRDDRKGRELILYSHQDNQVAIKFYKRMNFKEIAKIRNFYGKGRDGVKFSMI